MDQPPSSPLWLPPTSLQVHGQQLLAMTEQGPRPVHGLIHLASEGAVDPLEQNADVSLGIAGLMNAFRNGQVMMFNAPGLGFLQSPAWMGFMTPLSQQCLGQELILPSLPTWWCGESDVLESAMDLWADGWMLPTYPDDGLRPAQPMIDGGALTASQRAAWGSTLLSQGANHTIQARPPRGTHWDVLVLMHPDGSATSVCTGTHDPELAP